MMALKDRYGDTDVIASAFIKKALEWPTIRNTDTKLLDEFLASAFTKSTKSLNLTVF
jgi:hypothetical protein